MTGPARDVYIAGTVFDKEDMRSRIEGAEVFDGCIFRNCNFSSSALDTIKVLNCNFIACDLSLSSFSGALLDDVMFSECKMTGTTFGDRVGMHRICASFDECILDSALFCGIKAPKSLFRKCRMRETVFERCDLRESHFDYCEMSGAIFTGSNLTGTDFTSSTGWIIDPEDNKIKNARFSLISLPGLLAKYGIKVES